MAVPQTPVTLSPEQIGALSEKLSKARHDVNNCLSLIVAAAELTRRKPELGPRMTETIAQQPDKIIAELRAFTAEFETALGITRD
jgi:RecB family endonuclease NucS